MLNHCDFSSCSVPKLGMRLFGMGLGRRLSSMGTTLHSMGLGTRSFGNWPGKGFFSMGLGTTSCSTGLGTRFSVWAWERGFPYGHGNEVFSMGLGTRLFSMGLGTRLFRMGLGMRLFSMGLGKYLTSSDAVVSPIVTVWARLMCLVCCVTIGDMISTRTAFSKKSLLLSDKYSENLNQSHSSLLRSVIQKIGPFCEVQIIDQSWFVH